MTPESVEAALFLMSSISPSIFGALARKTQIEATIISLATKGLENEDCRAHFVALVSILWQHKIQLFQDSQGHLLRFLLASNAPTVWPLGEDKLIVPFLCDRFTFMDDLKPMILSALAAVASDRGSNLSPAILSLIEAQMISDEVKLSVDCVVNVLGLLKSIHGSLHTPLMISYVEKYVCAPASAVALRFPRGLMETDIDRIRLAAKECLISFAQKGTEESGARLLSHLIESIEHMPSVGMASVCEAITILLSKHRGQKMSPSQAFIGLVWLLVTIELSPDEKPQVTACLVSLAGLIHPSLDGVWEMGSESRLVNCEFSKELGFALESIEFVSREERDRFFNTGLETVIVLLPGQSMVPKVKALFIQAWAELMNLVLVDQSISAFSNRVLELLAMEDAITASEECVNATARAVGDLAERRFDAVVETFWKIHNQCSASLLALGGLQGGSISNALRVKNNKSSFRGLFAFESTERNIQRQLRVREITLRGIGFALSVCPSNRLSDLRTKECVGDMLLKELVGETAALKLWLQSNPGKEDVLHVETLLAAVESIDDVAIALDKADTGAIDLEFFNTKFHGESVKALLDILRLVGQDLPSFPMEPVLHSLAALIASRHFDLSSDQFGTVLETTLQALVYSVPDNPGALNAVSEEAVRLASRCQASALVVKALLGHASSWLGFSRLVKAVLALGGSGPLPLVRWVCVRIITALAVDTDIVRSDSDTEEFMEVMASLVPRVSDTYLPVNLLTKELVAQLLLRCQFTKDLPANAVESLSLSLAHVVPDKFVSGYVLSLIPGVHDADAGDAVVDAITHVLSQRASVFSAADSAAEAVVDAVLVNATTSAANAEGPIPTLSKESRIRLVSSLKFVAAVRFPIAIQEVLSGPEGDSKIYAIHSFVRDKQTLAFITKEFLERVNRMDGTEFRAASAVGYMMDCFDDTGVSGMADQFFPQFYVSLLVLLWRANEDQKTGIKLVIHKLCRAAGCVGRLPDSLSPENAVRLAVEKNQTLRLPMSEFLKQFLSLERGAVQRQAGIVLASQLLGKIESVDEEISPVMLSVCESGEGPVEVHHAMKGLSAVLKRLSITDVAVERILILFSLQIASFDSGIALEALCGISQIAYTRHVPKGIVHVLMSQTLSQLRRVVDHTDGRVRSQAFQVLQAVCLAVGSTGAVESDSTDPKILSQFFAAVSDLWIPCVVRSQDNNEIRIHAIRAFEAILNAAVSDEPVTIPGHAPLDLLFKLVKEEISECSVVHLNSCSYYFLGLPSVSEPVAIAAAKLAPVLISLIPEPAGGAITIVADMVEKMLGLSQTVRAVSGLIARVVVESQRLETIGVEASS